MFALVHRKHAVGLLMVAGVAVVAGAGVWAYRTYRSPDSGPAGQNGYTTTGMQLGGRSFTLDIADTPEKQILGLGKRSGLAADRGMVFPYATADKRCFWMKDMNFTIDIIWLDGNKQVVHIEPSLSPDTYPQTYCIESTQYVVELPAGTADKAGLKTGDKLPFQL